MAKTKKVSKPRTVKKAVKKEAVIPDSARITVLVKNPRREGTLAARTFAAYRTGMTVGEWREKVAAADLDAGYLHNDLRAERIRVTLPAKGERS